MRHRKRVGQAKPKKKCPICGAPMVAVQLTLVDTEPADRLCENGHTWGNLSTEPAVPKQRVMD